MQEQVYLNGELVLKKDAMISPFDRGFLFGDAIYEVIPVYDNQPFAVDFHYNRLKNNLSSVGIEMPFALDGLYDLIDKLLSQDVKPDLFAVYLQVSRGNSFSRQHLPSAKLKPTVFAFLQEMNDVTKDFYKNGRKAILSEDLRWRCSNIKATGLLANIIHLQQANSFAACEVLLHSNGVFTEGASSNVFFVKGRRLFTPLLNGKIIPGATRNCVIQIAKKIGLMVEEKPCDLSLLSAVDEIIMTGGTKELMPIVQVDDLMIGKGRPGLVWHELFDAYKEKIKENLSQKLNVE